MLVCFCVHLSSRISGCSCSTMHVLLLEKQLFHCYFPAVSCRFLFKVSLCFHLNLTVYLPDYLAGHPASSHCCTSNNIVNTQHCKRFLKKRSQLHSAPLALHSTGATHSVSRSHSSTRRLAASTNTSFTSGYSCNITTVALQHSNRCTEQPTHNHSSADRGLLRLGLT